MSKVSVVVPAYNAKTTIARVIDTLLCQTYDNWEIIIVDDGSSDNTGTIVKKYSDSRIRYIRQENSGPGAARNRGILEASGDYLMFLDADDVIVHDCLRVLVNLLETHDASIALCSYKKILQGNIDFEIENGLLAPSSNYGTNHKIMELSADECFRLMFYKKIYMPYPFLKLFRKSVISDIRFPEDIKLGEDLAFNIIALSRIQGKIIYTSDELYMYIQNNESITHSLDYRVAYDHWLQLNKILNETEGNNRKAVICRLFVVAYDYLSQSIEKMTRSDLYNECRLFIRKHKTIVLKDGNASIKVRLLAFFSFFSVSFGTQLCRLGRKINFQKAI